MQQNLVNVLENQNILNNIDMHALEMEGVSRDFANKVNFQKL